MNGDDNCIVNRCKCCSRHGRDAVVVLMLTGSFDVSGQASSAVKDCALAMLWRRHELNGGTGPVQLLRWRAQPDPPLLALVKCGA